jgi:amino acid transporter
MTAVRRLLSRKVSIGAMVEFGLWLGLVHVVIGLFWTFLHYDSVTQLGGELQPLFPAGAELVAFGVTTLLWPLMLLASVVCGA